MNNNLVYIIDLYSPYRDKNITETFRINDQLWCIKPVGLEWGLPVLPIQVTDDAPEPQDFHIYNTYKEAKNYIERLKKINRGI